MPYFRASVYNELYKLLCNASLPWVLHRYCQNGKKIHSQNGFNVPNLFDFVDEISKDEFESLLKGKSPEKQEKFKKYAEKLNTIAKNFKTLLGKLQKKIEIKIIEDDYVCHAEMKLLTHYVQSNNETKTYFGISKPCCAFCHFFLKKFMFGHPGGSKKAFMGWNFPPCLQSHCLERVKARIQDKEFIEKVNATLNPK